MALIQIQSDRDDPRAAHAGEQARCAAEGALVRMDTHCHSWASSAPVMAALAFMDMPECYSPPEKVYEQAMARGMDLVTITDHDTIAGGLELVERGFAGVMLGEEVTVYFPEDRCKLHVLVWGLDPQQHEAIGSLGLRDDVYAFSSWLASEGLAHAVAHPLYMQNGRLSRWHIERCAVVFGGFEVLNGAHSARHREPIEWFLDGLTPERLEALAVEHDLTLRYPSTQVKARTAGSDDHGLLNVGRTWTGVSRGRADANQMTPEAFFAAVMRGQSVVGGQGGHSGLLAHQLTTVGAHYYAQRIAARQSVRSRFIASKLLRFAGVEIKRPSRTRMAAHVATRKMFQRKKGNSLPILAALREVLEPTLAKYPQLREQLRANDPVTGSALSNHEQMAAFADDLSVALARALGDSTIRSLRKRDRTGLSDHVLSYAILLAGQLPAIFSLFYQNKERPFIESFSHSLDTPVKGEGASGLGTSERGLDTDPLGRPLRVCVLTDTLGDVNGVSRFIANIADRALASGRDVQVLTSTRRAVLGKPNIFNFEPMYSMRLPRYEDLEVVLPPVVAMLRHIDAHQPDCIHISTPGPVGLVGFLAARMLQVPVVGVYHTDFPAYIARLFEDETLTDLAQGSMRLFYRSFARVLTRSQAYIDELERLGIERDRCCAIMPGFECDQFSPTYRNEACFDACDGVGRAGVSKRKDKSVKVLYVGRVSVEKNMPMLVEIWKVAQKRLAGAGIGAQLVVVGDGPYRGAMTKALRGTNTCFFGFVQGKRLCELYASSDVFVFPSVTDTLGQVVMESQGSGLPVLVSDRGGPQEVVVDGTTGYVLPADDMERWIEAMIELVSDEAKRTAMGKAAYEHMQQFSIDRAFEHFWTLHEEAVAEHLATRKAYPIRGHALVEGSHLG